MTFIPTLTRASVRRALNRHVFAALALTLVAPPLGAQQVATKQCPKIRSTTATIGVGAYVCYGGNCILFDSTPQGTSHTFTVEPLLRGVPANGPAAGRLRDGDVIVAVNGALITTAVAGRILAAPIAGRAISFRIRRAGAEFETDVTPVAGCEQLGIVMADSPQAEARAVAQMAAIVARRGVRERSTMRPATAAEVSVDFGMTLQCGDCGWRVPLDGGWVRWQATERPRVSTVEAGGPADRAGVRVGDVLESLNDAPFVGGIESPIWNALRAGRSGTLRLTRDGSAVAIAITPRASRRSPF